MQELVKWLNDRTKEYDEGAPTVTDLEWDREYFRLQKMEAAQGKVLPESPTHRILYEVSTKLEKVEHNHAMLSADKTKDWNSFVNYFGNKDVIGMLKLDGLTLSLHYINGKLISAETRGDGHIGELVTMNAMTIPSIPKIIDYTDELVIDGEIICTYKDFEQFKNEYKNPRNFASGSIRLLDPNECKKRKLTFIPWHVVKGLTNNIITNFNELEKLGFTVAPWTSSLDLDAKDFLINCAKELGYPIDGLIGRFEDREYGDSLGATEHHTKAIYAFKMYDEEYDSQLIDIEWSMGRTGQLTPVAIYEDIDTGESILNRASLHNVSVLEETLGLPFKGQKIKVYKANQIIPQISWAEKINTEVGDYTHSLSEV